MTTRAELLSSEVFHATNIQLDLFRAVNNYLEEEGMTREDFADKVGMSKATVTQMLNGDFNGRLDRLVTLALAAGLVPKLTLHPLGDFVAHDAREQERAKAAWGVKHK